MITDIEDSVDSSDCMNFNRHLIWYTSETGVLLDRDQVDCHGEDNTCLLTSDNTLSNLLRCIALLFFTTPAVYVMIERFAQVNFIHDKNKRLSNK